VTESAIASALRARCGEAASCGNDQAVGSSKCLLDILAEEEIPMVCKMMLILTAAVLAAGVLAPAEASASGSKSRGARTGFHGADVYFPADYGPPIFAGGSVYCWHWFRIGRGWARAWAC
jgi:hypothetical protein